MDVWWVWLIASLQGYFVVGMATARIRYAGYRRTNVTRSLRASEARRKERERITRERTEALAREARAYGRAHDIRLGPAFDEYVESHVRLTTTPYPIEKAEKEAYRDASLDGWIWPFFFAFKAVQGTGYAIKQGVTRPVPHAKGERAARALELEEQLGMGTDVVIRQERKV